MNLEEVVTRAQVLLQAASMFGSPVEATSIVDVAENHEVTWRQDPASVRLNFNSIELLQRLGYLGRTPGSTGTQLTDAGRQVLAVGWNVDPLPDWISTWIEEESLREAMDARRSPAHIAISGLSVRNWRQFRSVDIAFHPRLTVLTGANGAGKTTLLNLLGPHFNWSAQLLVGKHKDGLSDPAAEVGTLHYTNGGRTALIQQSGVGVRNAPLSMPQMQNVSGIFINSHRSVSAYQPLNALPPRFSESEAILQQFSAEIQVRHSGGASQFPPLYRMKEALVAAAMYAYGNQAVRADAAARDVWEGYQDVLRQFLPSTMGFRHLEVDDSEIIFVTDSSEFPLEAVSGGISAMLELSWQIFLRRRNQAVFTVCIDEPENHLHPELQRSIMPSLLAAFPDVGFIVATHSPFVVTAVPDAFVYALGVEEAGLVDARRIDQVNASATPDETLMSVLGLDSALPIWAESRVSELMSQLGESPGADELRGFRDDLRRLGLDRQFPAAVRSLGPKHDD